MNTVITSFFTNEPDVQRGVKWEPNEQLIYPLAWSCERRGVGLVVLNDCFEDGYRNGVEFVRVESTMNPYFQRWKASRDYLLNNPDVERAFLVDSTDVIMLFDPFYTMEDGYIYVGDEFDVVGSQWIRDNAKHPVLQGWVNQNKDVLLLNCGVVGGSRDDLIDICFDIVTNYEATNRIEIVEMPLFNFIMRGSYNDRLIRGRSVTTIFKSYEEKSMAWWKHK